MSYVVGIFNAPGPQAHYVFPNVFPDLDMAQDCVMYQIKEDYGDELAYLDMTDQLGGNITIHYEDTVYVITKLFNFKIPNN